MNLLARCAFTLLLASLAVCQDPNPGDVPASAEASQQAKRQFCRLVEAKQEARLDVLVATYRRGDATLTMYGCIHIADREFYEGMQKRFAAHDALLYELIAPPSLRPYPGMPTGGDHWISMVQGGMGAGLKLADQFGVMDYRQDNFVHADMTGEEWRAALRKAGGSELGEVLKMAPTDVDRDKEAQQRPVDLVEAFRSGGGTPELRIVLGRTMTSADAEPTQPTVIIHGRNERCLQVLTEQLQAGKKNLGIFYGAAHLQHMERRLLEDFGWQRVREEWVMAWDCRASKFPKVEKGLKRKRYRARKDLGKLAKAVASWCAGHKGQRPNFDKLRRASANGKLPGRQDGKDPWGRPYVLRPFEGGYELRCLASDGKVDTEDDLSVPVGQE